MEHREVRDVLDGTGRILVSGVDRGSGFTLAGRVVITASHVARDAGAGQVKYVPAGHIPLDVTTLDRDDELDIAMLRLKADAPSTLTIAQAVDDAGWYTEARPRSDDPKLTGVIDSAQWPHRVRQRELPFLQLRVDQDIATFKGYSGGAVCIKSSRDAVVGDLGKVRFRDARSDRLSDLGSCLIYGRL